MRTAVAEIDKAAIPTCGIAVMAKASIAGRTKTRLVPPLTFEEAAQCNTAFLRDIADNILAASAQASTRDRRTASYIASAQFTLTGTATGRRRSGTSSS